MKSASTIAKPHYPILDGLRGVAAVTVVAFHICEAHATSHLTQIINHGYLAVDFFFLLSGFVIGYAYDDRWNNLTLSGFFKRRLIRLHPLVILGSLIGAALFYFQGGTMWPLIQHTPVWKTLLLMIIGCTLLPIPISMDIRGWQEMHPLNGPAWSLLFEYIVNIFYAIGVRKFSKTALSILVAIAAIILIQYAVTVPTGDMAGGWSLDATQLRTGFTRVLFPFFGGLLLSRTISLVKIKGAFLWCSLMVIGVLAMPRVGGATHFWMNGLYEALSIIFVFPLIVWLGASGTVESKTVQSICRFLGDISYPIYITHYPIIYIYTAWVYEHHYSLSQVYPTALLTLVSAMVLAYGCLKLYDEPARRWLTAKFLHKPLPTNVTEPVQANGRKQPSISNK
jgi:peptidoglycan/LPS O-acetylase OafA/YrhL